MRARRARNGLMVLFMIVVASAAMVGRAGAAAAPKCPSNKSKLVVAKIGGDYTTITAALAITCLGLGSSTIVHNRVNGNVGFGILIGLHGVVRGNVVTENDYGIGVYGDAVDGNGKPNDVEISNNTVTGNGVGIAPGNTSGPVSGNNVRANTSAGIALSGFGVTVIANAITANGGHGVFITGSPKTAPVRWRISTCRAVCRTSATTSMIRSPGRPRSEDTISDRTARLGSHSLPT